MRTATMVASLTILFLLVVGSAWADEIKISGVHNCCGACCKAIHEALGKVEGVSDVTAEPKKPDFTFQATDTKVARRAIGAVARAGFYGQVDDDKLTFPKRSGVKPGKVTRLSLVGLHNCCPGCCKAAKDAIAKVKGVEADTLKPKSRKFVVEGDFDGAALVKALNDAGFFVRNAPKLSLDHVPQLSMQGLAAALGAPEKTFEFTLDENVSEFRIPLLNKFSSAQVKEGAIRLTEVTFELDEKNYLTVWFNGTQYVDHFAYDKLTDF